MNRQQLDLDIYIQRFLPLHQYHMIQNTGKSSFFYS